ncbi:HipA N-terminal domain-containing protein [Mycolicibacterium boenickei]|uniref:HipA N-terminal domain-containing protein n=1 Tax=Mycolicibacterium boenickei TaxID=146017 RepID=A0AAX2ZYN1_9MYCO|nr:HipA N-terminal domain-containing protein [Mycolicibacterium boenickei]UNC00395.1 HipA N-terminal domain-containing protein [Mycolicibacterium boenickei]
MRRSNDDIAEVDVSFDDFAGLLPEGVQLGVVTTLTKTSADDHLTLLLAIGADTIGNSLGPTSSMPASVLVSGHVRRPE